MFRKPSAQFIVLLAVFLMPLISGKVLATNAEAVNPAALIPKKILVEQNMMLTDSQAPAFWKVYGDYEIALDQIHWRLEELIRSYVNNTLTLSDDEAESLIRRYLDIEKDRIAVRAEYLPKFKEVLSGRQVARLYQIENKIEAVTKFGLANMIPLVDTSAMPQTPPPPEPAESE